MPYLLEVAPKDLVFFTESLYFRSFGTVCCWLPSWQSTAIWPGRLQLKHVNTLIDSPSFDEGKAGITAVIALTELLLLGLKLRWFLVLFQFFALLLDFFVASLFFFC